MQALNNNPPIPNHHHSIIITSPVQGTNLTPKRKRVTPNLPALASKAAIQKAELRLEC